MIFKLLKLFDFKAYRVGYLLVMRIIVFQENGFLFLQYNFCLTPNLFKTLQECQRYDAKMFSLNEV